MSYERDKFLTEAMLNCEHDYQSYPKPYGYGDFDTEEVCDKCGHKEGNLYCFSNWGGFGRLWEWSIKQAWFDVFVVIYFTEKYLKGIQYSSSADLLRKITPTIFADAIYDFLKDRK